MTKSITNYSAAGVMAIVVFTLAYVLGIEHCQAVNHSSAMLQTSPSNRVAETSDSTSSKPTPPAVFLDTTMPRQSGRTMNVAAGATAQELQKALDSAAPGDTILLAAGASFAGNFVLPKKPGDKSDWIIIRTSAPDSQLPPSGTRITPAHAGQMAKLVSPNADPALKTSAGAHHYRLIGIEFTVAPSVSINYDLLQLGSGKQTSLAEAPHDLILDRCYIHGNASANLRRGIALNSARTAIIDSYISECHERGADSQAICGWNGPGPFKIVNNYLEGAGENVMFGGADAKIANLVPADIEFRRNHCFKPLSWKKNHPSYAGQPWSVKNIFELKNARRVVVEGNLFENNWVDAQNGFAILFTVRNQEGAAPWSTVEDVLFANNLLRHTGAAINILGRDNNYQSGQAKRIEITNNLFYDIGGKEWGGNGCFLQVTDTRAVVVNHNTVMQAGNIIIGYGEPNEGFIFTNNLTAHNEYGVIGDGTGPGKVTLDKYFPNLTFKKNALIGGQAALYPSDNLFPTEMKEIDKQNLNLAEAVSFKQPGTDGKNIGCDWRLLESALGGLRSTIATGN